MFKWYYNIAERKEINFIESKELSHGQWNPDNRIGDWPMGMISLVGRAENRSSEQFHHSAHFQSKSA